MTSKRPPNAQPAERAPENLRLRSERGTGRTCKRSANDERKRTVRRFEVDELFEDGFEFWFEA